MFHPKLLFRIDEEKTPCYVPRETFFGFYGLREWEPTGERIREGVQEGADMASRGVGTSAELNFPRPLLSSPLEQMHVCGMLCWSWPARTRFSHEYLLFSLLWGLYCFFSSGMIFVLFMKSSSGPVHWEQFGSKYFGEHQLQTLPRTNRYAFPHSFVYQSGWAYTGVCGRISQQTVSCWSLSSSDTPWTCRSPGLVLATFPRRKHPPPKQTPLGCLGLPHNTNWVIT